MLHVHGVNCRSGPRLSARRLNPETSDRAGLGFPGISSTRTPRGVVPFFAGRSKEAAPLEPTTKLRGLRCNYVSRNPPDGDQAGPAAIVPPRARKATGRLFAVDVSIGERGLYRPEPRAR